MAAGGPPPGPLPLGPVLVPVHSAGSADPGRPVVGHAPVDAPGGDGGALGAAAAAEATRQLGREMRVLPGRQLLQLPHHQLATACGVQRAGANAAGARRVYSGEHRGRGGSGHVAPGRRGHLPAVLQQRGQVRVVGHVERVRGHLS